MLGPVTVNPAGTHRGRCPDQPGHHRRRPSFFSLCGAQGSGPAPTVAQSVTDAPVPIWVGEPAAGCAGTRFVGGANLSDNLAVTFGANIMSHATVDGSGQHRPRHPELLGQRPGAHQRRSAQHRRLQDRAVQRSVTENLETISEEVAFIAIFPMGHRRAARMVDTA